MKKYCQHLKGVKCVYVFDRRYDVVLDQEFSALIIVAYHFVLFSWSSYLSLVVQYLAFCLCSDTSEVE